MKDLIFRNKKIEKKEKCQVDKIRSERWNITTDTTEIQRS